MAEDSAKTSAKATYRDAGVDIDAGNALVRAIAPLAARTQRPGADGALGGFGGVFDMKGAGFSDPVLVACNDGVGTKLKIAIESGQHDTVGIDLVAMCVNDLIVQGAEPLFFLDYFACSRLDVEIATAVVAGVADGCRQAGCALIGGETAEMPGMYADGDYDLAGFAVGAVERGALLPRDDISAGDVLIGLASDGLHSNGFSLIRRLVSEQDLALNAPASFAPDQDLATALMTPTRIYVASVLQAFRETGAIKALAHITGGGLSENIPRVLPPGLRASIDLGTWTAPAVFGWLQQAGQLDIAELARTFNCGIGLVAVVAEADVAAVESCLRAAGEATHVIGRIEASASGSEQIRLDGRLEFAS